MSDTKIEWTNKTWNPLTGCTKVSPGCDHCYAKTMHERFNGPGSFDTITLHPGRLGQPLKWRTPAKVFVNSMSDLFQQDVPDEYIVQVFDTMANASRHTFQLLTKRHARMRSFVRRYYSGAFATNPSAPMAFIADHPIPNLWLGVSVESQQWADIRIPALLDTPAAVRFISAEPLLGPVGLKSAALRPYERQQGGFWEYGHGEDDYGNGKVWVPAPPAQLDWVIVGGESGPGARPMHPDWARSLRDQCQCAGVPYLFKQWGAHDASGKRVGKGKAGRELDGREWNEYPVTP
jgi:protein gp37